MERTLKTHCFACKAIRPDWQGIALICIFRVFEKRPNKLEGICDSRRLSLKWSWTHERFGWTCQEPGTDFRRLFTPPLLTDFLKGHPKQNLWPLTAFEEFWPLRGCDHMLVQYGLWLAMWVCVFIQLPAASPADVSGLWAWGLLDVRWDIAGGLSGACWRRF